MCECGSIKPNMSAPHIISASDGGKRYVTCLDCLPDLDMNKDEAMVGLMSHLVTQVTLNGSYILPSGIIVLVDEDIEAYRNGTLVFYNKDELPVTQ